jgi:HEPN domain-containing protein
MSQKVINNWLALAEYDLSTAKAMLQTQRYLYVGFMCQQAVEKVLKACYVKHHNSTPPYTHNLLRLLAELPWKADIDTSMIEVIEMLNSYYIESRYTEDVQELAKALTELKAGAILKSTQEVFGWIRSRL